jgi:rubrerythrin
MQILKHIQSVMTEHVSLDWLRSANNESLQTTLYTCGACDTTYIASEMQSCPECEAVVNEVPSGTELGYTSVS